MSGNLESPGIRVFRVGPKNKRLEDPAAAGQESGYHVAVNSDDTLEHLLLRNGLEIDPTEKRLTPEAFPWAQEGVADKYFELFDFSFRSEYGRSGVDEAFIRDKLDLFKFRPATLPDLLCFGGHFRVTYDGQWFPSKRIIALGSVLTTTETVKTGGWFGRRIRGTFQHYPELECVAGRPRDVVRLSRTECNTDGNWPTDVLFLATPMA